MSLNPPHACPAASYSGGNCNECIPTIQPGLYTAHFTLKPFSSPLNPGALLPLSFYLTNLYVSLFSFPLFLSSLFQYFSLCFWFSIFLPSLLLSPWFVIDMPHLASALVPLYKSCAVPYCTYTAHMGLLSMPYLCASGTRACRPSTPRCGKTTLAASLMARKPGEGRPSAVFLASSRDAGTRDAATAVRSLALQVWAICHTTCHVRLHT